LPTPNSVAISCWVLLPDKSFCNTVSLIWIEYPMSISSMPHFQFSVEATSILTQGDSPLSKPVNYSDFIPGKVLSLFWKRDYLFSCVRQRSVHEIPRCLSIRGRSSPQKWCSAYRIRGVLRGFSEGLHSFWYGYFQFFQDLALRLSQFGVL
jgi:hypothetical protein